MNVATFNAIGSHIQPTVTTQEVIAMNPSATLARPTFAVGSKNVTISKASAEIVARHADTDQFDAFEDRVLNFYSRKGVTINDAIAMADRASRPAPLTEGLPVQPGSLIAAAESAAPATQVAAWEGIVGQYIDPLQYPIQMCKVTDERTLDDLLIRVTDWVDGRLVQRGTEWRTVYSTRFMGAVALDMEADGGRPSLWKPGVDHVVFVYVPQGDRAHRGQGADTDGRGGYAAALLVTPATYLNRKKNTTGVDTKYRFANNQGYIDDLAQLHAVRWFRTGASAKLVMEQLRDAVTEANEARRQEAAEYEMAMAAESSRFKDDGAQATIRDDDAPF